METADHDPGRARSASVDPDTADGATTRAAELEGDRQVGAHAPQLLAAEHWSLLSARSLIWNEAQSRATVFLTVLSASIIAVALVADATGFGSETTTLALVLLPVVFLLGVAAYLRLVQINTEEFQLVLAMNQSSSLMSYSSSLSWSPRLISALPTCGTDLLRLGQFLHVLGKAGLEVDDLGPGWRDANEHHLLVETTCSGLPFRHALISNKSSGGLDEFVRHAIDGLECRLAPYEEDVRRKVFSVDRQRHLRIGGEGFHFRGDGGRTHDEDVAVPDEADGDDPW
jgi:hypothetical protein